MVEILTLNSVFFNATGGTVFVMFLELGESEIRSLEIFYL